MLIDIAPTEQKQHGLRIDTILHWIGLCNFQQGLSYSHVNTFYPMINSFRR